MEYNFSILTDRKSKNTLMRHNNVTGINFSGKSAVSKISYLVLSYFDPPHQSQFPDFGLDPDFFGQSGPDLGQDLVKSLDFPQS